MTKVNTIEKSENTGFYKQLFRVL